MLILPTQCPHMIVKWEGGWIFSQPRDQGLAGKTGLSLLGLRGELGLVQWGWG